MSKWIKYFLYILISLIFVIFVFPIIRPLVSGYEIRYSRKKILYETDYRKLLEAGREVLSKAQIDEVMWMGDHKQTFYKLPKDIKIPKIIRRLSLFGSPIVRVSDDYYALSIAINNRVSCVGVTIYPKDFNEPENKFNNDNKELLPGLWYFDEEYNYDPNGYDKVINSIMKTGKYPAH